MCFLAPKSVYQHRGKRCTLVPTSPLRPPYAATASAAPRCSPMMTSAPRATGWATAVARRAFSRVVSLDSCTTPPPPRRCVVPVWLLEASPVTVPTSPRVLSLSRPLGRTAVSAKAPRTPTSSPSLARDRLFSLRAKHAPDPCSIAAAFIRCALSAALAAACVLAAGARGAVMFGWGVPVLAASSASSSQSASSRSRSSLVARERRRWRCSRATRLTSNVCSSHTYNQLPQRKPTERRVAHVLCTSGPSAASVRPSPRP